jgi:hypothetical protein
VTATRATSRPGIPQFLLWALIGAGVCLGVLSALTIGVFVLPVALLAGGLLLWRKGVSLNVAGALSGAGVIPLYVSWLNRDGPGVICKPLGVSGESCVEQWSPWPWLVAGSVFIAAGVILFGRLRRKSSELVARSQGRQGR